MFTAGFGFDTFANTVSVVSIRTQPSSSEPGAAAFKPSLPPLPHPLEAGVNNFDLSLLRRDGLCGWCRDADVTPDRRGGRFIECC